MIFFVVLFCSTIGFSQQQNATFTTNPTFFEENDEIVLTVSDIDPGLWGVTDIYLWAWYYDTDGNPAGDSPTNGTWENSNESQKFTNNGNGTYSFTFTPADLFDNTGIGSIGVLAKAKNGTGDKKTQDHIIEVGLFQVTVISPSQPNTVVSSGSNLPISATASVNANFKLFANGTQVNAQNNITNYNFNYSVTQDTFFELEVTAMGSTVVKTFNVILTPNPNLLPVPSGMYDGINFDPNNPTTVTLVLYAPQKNYVHLIGNFHDTDWRLTNEYLLNKDTSSNRHWITLTGLNPSEDLLYQYMIDAQIVVADPYSYYILDQHNDPFISEETFAEIPDYPVGKTSHAVTWVDLDEEVYEWQITDFERVAHEDMVVYELLIRDFTESHSFQAVIDRLGYLNLLGVNVIELMPVSEFDGNISWGYNPSFHMALDKYYGDRNTFKKFVDEAHAMGIAVVLDVVYNHATGQNPYYRMWNNCGGCYQGQATGNNPFFNVTDPNTTFQFFNDIDHQSVATQHYIDRLNQYWLEEYNIDGFRFDFTKGFTNVVGDGGSYDAQRIGILQRMYDKIKEVDLTSYVILEHFAPNSEETELIEYRATSDPDESGMLVWSNHNYNYNQATMGYDNSDFSWISYQNRGWDTPSNIGYMESHDEERLMYKNLEYGNSSGNYNIQELETALERQKLAGVFYFTIPGPKMIWQFGELGYDFSINRCPDGTINPDCRTDPKPIAFNLGYYYDPLRKDLYLFWRRLLELKREERIFKTNHFTLEVADDYEKKIYLVDNEATGDEIKYVIIVGNFGVTPLTTQPFFQETGTWYNMIDNSPFEVNDTQMSITLSPGEFRVFANGISVLETQVSVQNSFRMYPNPATNKIYFTGNISNITVWDLSGKNVLNVNNYTANQPIDVSQWESGIYLVRIINHQQTQNFKFIKN